MGLLLSHKSTITVYADCVSIVSTEENKRRGGGKKGEIIGFSKRSRCELFKLLHSITFKTMTFVTLTYPMKYPGDSKEYKANLKEWRRRLERIYGNMKAVWRLEFQKRGAPHFHIMYFDVPFLDIKKISAIWYDIVGSRDEKHLKCGVDLKKVVNSSEQRIIASYMSKYVAKMPDGSENGADNKCGRWWGKWNIEAESKRGIELENWEVQFIVDSLGDNGRSNISWANVGNANFTLFGDSLGSCQFGDYVIELAERIRNARDSR